MSGSRDGASALGRTLSAMARAAGLEIVIDGLRSTPWASALFVGEQVRLTIGGTDGDRLNRWLDTLAEAEFALRTHVVADFAVEHVQPGSAEAFVLLIEDSAG